MFIMFRALILLASLFIALSFASFSYAGAGRTAAQFLSLGGGTRAAGMGDAFATVSGDVTSAFWNPSGLAGLSELKETQIATAYTNYATVFGEAGEGLYYGLGAIALPAGEWGVIGTTLQIQGQGSVPLTTDSPEILGQIDLGTNWAWAVSYADKVFPKLLFGINGKIIRQVLGPESATAYAVDVGTQYDLGISLLPTIIGVSLQNLGTRIQFKDAGQSDPLPRTLRWGMGVVPFKARYHLLRVTTDFIAFVDKLAESEEEKKIAAELKVDKAAKGIGMDAFRWRNLQKSVGLEYWLGDILALRAGYKDDPFIDVADIQENLTFGFGVKYTIFQFDYARVRGGGPDNKQINTLALLLRF